MMMMMISTPGRGGAHMVYGAHRLDILVGVFISGRPYAQDANSFWRFLVWYVIVGIAGQGGLTPVSTFQLHLEHFFVG